MFNIKKSLIASQSYFCFDKSNQNHFFVRTRPNEKNNAVRYDNLIFLIVLILPFIKKQPSALPLFFSSVISITDKGKVQSAFYKSKKKKIAASAPSSHRYFVSFTESAFVTFLHLLRNSYSDIRFPLCQLLI